MRQDRSCGPKILVRQHFTNKHRNPMSSARPASPAVPEWLTSLRAVQGELPAPTRYLTASVVSLDRYRGRHPGGRAPTGLLRQVYLAVAD
jgi:hypothetical protein